MVSPHVSCYTNYCARLKRTQKYRFIPQFTQNEVYLDFTSNDYLGLCNHPLLKSYAQEALKTRSLGAGASRLLRYDESLALFEEEIAFCKKTQAALIMNSGYTANCFTLESLLDSSVLGKKPCVFFDRLNHSSLYQGVFLSGATLYRYPHLDMNALEDLLKNHSNEGPPFIVSETLFGMDGDKAPLHDLIHLAKHYNALLYLDEAHATGLFGKDGYGLSTPYDLSDVEHVIMGTFSKALGGFGAYIATSMQIKAYLINRCPSFIYSTALPPFFMGVMKKAWNLIPSLQGEVKNLMNRASLFRDVLSQRGYDTLNTTTHIIPLILGSEEKAMQLSQHMRDHHVLISCIRPPTVPPNTSRLRFSLTINHTQDDLDQCLNLLPPL